MNSNQGGPAMVLPKSRLCSKPFGPTNFTLPMHCAHISPDISRRTKPRERLNDTQAATHLQMQRLDLNSGKVSALVRCLNHCTALAFVLATQDLDLSLFFSQK